jgi:hypothetical protein
MSGQMLVLGRAELGLDTNGSVITGARIRSHGERVTCRRAVDDDEIVGGASGRDRPPCRS